MVPALFNDQNLPRYLNSDDWAMRCAGFAALSQVHAWLQWFYSSCVAVTQMAEGCISVFSEQLEPIVAKVLLAVHDADPRVRYMAITCLGQMGDSILPHHIMTHVASGTDLSPHIQEKCHKEVCLLCNIYEPIPHTRFSPRLWRGCRRTNTSRLVPPCPLIWPSCQRYILSSGPKSSSCRDHKLYRGDRSNIFLRNIQFRDAQEMTTDLLREYIGVLLEVLMGSIEVGLNRAGGIALTPPPPSALRESTTAPRSSFSLSPESQSVAAIFSSLTCPRCSGFPSNTLIFSRLFRLSHGST